MQRRIAMAGVAAVAAVTALCANSGCGQKAASTLFNGPPKVSVGPWVTDCSISHKGIADLNFINSGGRKLQLSGFTITLKNDSGHTLKSRHIKLGNPVNINGTNGIGFGYRVTEYVTYAATSCGVTNTLPRGEGS